ncbi:MAG: galactose mutarotase [Gammaproteobacteria bacterium]|nr:galactose mutarotase [Gammaproteobacteria bacterium]
MQVTQFGDWQGQPVLQCTLKSATGVEIDIINWGAAVRDWRVPVRSGRPPRSVVLGFDRFEPYPEHSPYFGAIAGRVANRIARGRFTLLGRDYQLACNNGRHHLHGGPGGFGRLLWSLATDRAANAVQLRCTSPDGDEGYPGALEASVSYRLQDYRLAVEMTAVPDRSTPVNLAQHSYFNLNGDAQVGRHRLRVNADRYTPLDGELIPTGEIAAVDGTVFDFREARDFLDPSGAIMAYDINLVLDSQRDPQAPVAHVRTPGGELELRQWTDQPAVQLFNAGTVQVGVTGLGGRSYGAFCGLCLEAQHFADSVNQPDFPSIIAAPDRPYRQRTAYEIAPCG